MTGTNPLNPLQHQANHDSFISKDPSSAVVSKLANRLGCSSVLSRRSKQFKSLSPVNLMETAWDKDQNPNPTSGADINYLVQGEQKSIGVKAPYQIHAQLAPHSLQRLKSRPVK